MSSTSLHERLLRWLLPSILLVLSLSMVGDWLLAVRPVWEHADKALADASLLLKDRLQSACDNGLARGMPVLPEEASPALAGDPDDPLFFSIRTLSGQHLAGVNWLYRPVMPAPESRHFDTLQHGGDEIRYQVYRTRVRGQEFLIHVGESTRKRKALSERILLGMLVPELVTLLLVTLLMMAGVRRGLAPLERWRLSFSTPGKDLQSVSVREAPAEMAPFLHSHNQQADRLADSLALQETFLTQAAHQLRTPLAGLRIQSELASRLLPAEADPALRHAIAQIDVASERAMRLARQLLGMARSQSAAVDFSPLALDELATRAVQRHLDAAQLAGIDLGLEVQQAQVTGNALLLDELLANLIDNALCYVPRGGHVTVSVMADGLLTVSDDGPGIPEGDRARVFERFFRRQTDTRGVGLGLAIVDEIVRLHHADIALDSAPEGGARFSIRFPRTSAPD